MNHDHNHHCQHYNHSQDHNKQDQNFIAKMEFLDSKQRERLIPPEDLIHQMPIQKNHTLLDVGAGTGFFTIPMAETTSHKVYAMDPDKRMLGIIESKAKEKGLQNIEPLQETIEHLSLQNNSIDFVMASLILHEVKSLPFALSKIFDVLSEGGHLLCLEYEKEDHIKEGPPMSIRIHSEELKTLLLAIGFDVVKKTKINEAIYTILAVKFSLPAHKKTDLK